MPRAFCCVRCDQDAEGLEKITMLRHACLTRRDLLRLSVGSLLTAGLWPGALRAEGKGNSGNFHFVAVNDIHYLNDQCGRWFEGVLRQMQGHAEKIEFCLLSGDLTEHGRRDQLAAMHDILPRLGKPVHVVIGNHDYITQDDRRAYDKFFPQRNNYHFEHSGWQFIGLDTTQGQRVYGTKVPEETLRWLDETLPTLDKQRPTVVFTHFPLGPLVITRPGNAAQLLARFKEYNLQAVFSGHYHAFTERQIGKLTLTTDRCCSRWHKNHDGSKEKGYFLCHAHDGIIQRTFVEVKVG